MRSDSVRPLSFGMRQAKSTAGTTEDYKVVTKMSLPSRSNMRSDCVRQINCRDMGPRGGCETKIGGDLSHRRCVRCLGVD
mgnify:CR=1 FL=1